ncbi:hypothetical protein SDC9_126155 [bioreactor metagenome]|uniref:Uncharacterized protein n=1 Tax=bioreactor metagenome TaxID=1076179 RepID=A0A645CQG9_9ZZZZ
MSRIGAEVAEEGEVGIRSTAFAARVGDVLDEHPYHGSVGGCPPPVGGVVRVGLFPPGDFGRYFNEVPVMEMMVVQQTVRRKAVLGGGDEGAPPGIVVEEVLRRVLEGRAVLRGFQPAGHGFRHGGVHLPGSLVRIRRPGGRVPYHFRRREEHGQPVHLLGAEIAPLGEKPRILRIQRLAEVRSHAVGLLPVGGVYGSGKARGDFKDVHERIPRGQEQRALQRRPVPPRPP